MSKGNPLVPSIIGRLQATRIEELESENAKLRDEFRKMDEWHSKELAAAIDENAKLLELARDLYECVSHANEQDWFYFERNMLGCGMCCTVNGEGCGLSVLTDRLRELGVNA